MFRRCCRCFFRSSESVEYLPQALAHLSVVCINVAGVRSTCIGWFYSEGGGRSATIHTIPRLVSVCHFFLAESVAALDAAWLRHDMVEGHSYRGANILGEAYERNRGSSLQPTLTYACFPAE